MRMTLFEQTGDYTAIMRITNYSRLLFLRMLTGVYSQDIHLWIVVAGILLIVHLRGFW